MGSKRLATPDRSKNLSPPARERVEQSRKRFQCDLFGFWARCTLLKCRQRHRCLGDPHDCLKRNHAAMPGDHKHWSFAAFFSETTGVKTTEQELRAAGLALPGRLRAKRRRVPRRHQVVLPVVSAEEAEARRQAQRKAEALARVAPRGMASLEKDLKELGMKLRVIDPKPPGTAAAPPVASAQESEESRETRRKEELFERVAPRGMASLESDLNELGLTVACKIDWKTGKTLDMDPDERGMTPDEDESQLVEWTPMVGSSVPVGRAAGLPPPPHSGSGDATAASPAEADAGSARPPAATRPPGVEPWQAWCDDEGRLHMPDPAVVKERYRMLTAAEIDARIRSYGSSA